MREQLKALRAAMARKGVDWYLVVSSDFHSSEYVGDYFKSRKYLSGFTGSAGSLLVSQDWAGLWTDGRYFLQAAQQLAGSGIELMKIGEEGVPTIPEFLKEHVNGGLLGFDGRTINVRLYRELKENAGRVDGGMDLVDEVWKDRPSMSAKPVYELPLSACGKSRADKLTEIRETLKDNQADVLVLSALMDICWLLNLRGDDVECTPVVLSYCALTEKECRLFINAATLSAEIRAALEKDGVTVCPYNEVYTYIRELRPGTRLEMNPDAVNSLMLESVPAGVELLELPDPTTLPKSAKNATEVANMREAHIRDGVAVTRFIYWLKHNIGKEPMDELSVAEKLESFRREQPDYLGPSFTPIMGYGPHGAIVHYGATPETCAKLEPRSFLLSDTGGHYLQGTTDITRTIAMGPLTGEEKHIYTLVLKGHLHLGAARFVYGVTGEALDVLARMPLWQEGLDFNHGTGHGVGYILSVHEGPQRIRWTNKTNGTPMEPGMITSDEPGMYLEGKFGVRLENLTVVVDEGKLDYGRFLHMEYLTMVPWDLEAINADELTSEEKAWLNDYHRQVRENLLPRMNAEEGEWLREATRAI